MDFKQELNHQLLLQREENLKHLEYEKEFGLYKAIAAGDLEEVNKRHKWYEESSGYADSNAKNGTLSQNPLQNRKFHFVILTAMITRFCVEAGLEREAAYSMSDIFIQKADLCTTISQIDTLQATMIQEYTMSMRNNQKKNIYSRPIAKCIDYIYDNLNQKLKVQNIAAYLNINPSYLSRLFSREVGISLSAYIRDKRLDAAAQMLQYSNYSITDISEYLDFSSQSHFTSAFQSKYGITPKRYRDKYATKSMPLNG